ncbi:putative Inositol hexakisphosphate and diphosphoinositol-pentakisphosphate kinase 1 [Paratrimastix pyriformis]|uniref:diphosphoinositol-pentakisphosphate 1-kinase n=1 Tax=Paratrimastix pyriformis TaxID=342808 RepID=A0ABQ8UMM9_9EUKA|nr:putative Inositol hexakisphosphate and diphosphoinositol-pentakisphosphate kinase 1 [Paratrimastix pyriformis]
MREVTTLTEDERNYCSIVGRVFRQRVCGLDLLRHMGQTMVCDVNGWSFVKGDTQYYTHCSRLLRNIMLQAACRKAAPPVPAISREGEVLRQVMGIFRHGDITPKQKIRIHIHDDMPLLDFFEELNQSDYRKNHYDDEPLFIVRHNCPERFMALSDLLCRIIQERVDVLRSISGSSSLPPLCMPVSSSAASLDKKPSTSTVGVAEAPGPAGGPKSRDGKPSTAASTITPPIPIPPIPATSGDSSDSSVSDHQSPPNLGTSASVGSFPVAAGLADNAALRRVLSEMPPATDGLAPGSPLPLFFDPKYIQNLMLLRSVLELHLHGTKLQIRPLKRNADGRVIAALLQCKWGGVLTHAGLSQSHTLGKHFRLNVLPKDEETRQSFLSHLHVYTNHERSVQRSAIAFIEGLLDAPPTGDDRLPPSLGAGPMPALGWHPETELLMTPTWESIRSRMVMCQRRLENVILANRSFNGEVFVAPHISVLQSLGLRRLGNASLIVKKFKGLMDRFTKEMQIHYEHQVEEQNLKARQAALTEEISPISVVSASTSEPSLALGTGPTGAVPFGHPAAPVSPLKQPAVPIASSAPSNSPLQQSQAAAAAVASALAIAYAAATVVRAPVTHDETHSGGPSRSPSPQTSVRIVGAPSPAPAHDTEEEPDFLAEAARRVPTPPTAAVIQVTPVTFHRLGRGWTSPARAVAATLGDGDAPAVPSPAPTLPLMDPLRLPLITPTPNGIFGNPFYTGSAAMPGNTYEKFMHTLNKAQATLRQATELSIAGTPHIGALANAIKSRRRSGSNVRHMPEDGVLPPRPLPGPSSGSQMPHQAASPPTRQPSTGGQQQPPSNEESEGHEAPWNNLSDEGDPMEGTAAGQPHEQDDSDPGRQRLHWIHAHGYHKARYKELHPTATTTKIRKPKNLASSATPESPQHQYEPGTLQQPQAHHHHGHGLFLHHRSSTLPTGALAAMTMASMAPPPRQEGAPPPPGAGPALAPSSAAPTKPPGDESQSPRPSSSSASALPPSPPVGPVSAVPADSIPTPGATDGAKAGGLFESNSDPLFVAVSSLPTMLGPGMAIPDKEVPFCDLATQSPSMSSALPLAQPPPDLPATAADDGSPLGAPPAERDDSEAPLATSLPSSLAPPTHIPVSALPPHLHIHLTHRHSSSSSSGSPHDVSSSYVDVGAGLEDPRAPLPPIPRPSSHEYISPALVASAPPIPPPSLALPTSVPIATTAVLTASSAPRAPSPYSVAGGAGRRASPLTLTTDVTAPGPLAETILGSAEAANRSSSRLPGASGRADSRPGSPPTLPPTARVAAAAASRQAMPRPTSSESGPSPAAVAPASATPPTGPGALEREVSTPGRVESAPLEASYQKDVERPFARCGGSEPFCCGENLPLVQMRWQKFLTDFYDEQTSNYDTTWIPDIYEALKFDIVHNRYAFSAELREILDQMFSTLQPLADLAVPQEYGIMPHEKLHISDLLSGPLLRQIIDDITAMATKQPPCFTHMREEFRSDSPEVSRETPLPEQAPQPGAALKIGEPAIFPPPPSSVATPNSISVCTPTPLPLSPSPLSTPTPMPVRCRPEAEAAQSPSPATEAQCAGPTSTSASALASESMLLAAITESALAPGIVAPPSPVTTAALSPAPATAPVAAAAAPVAAAPVAAAVAPVAAAPVAAAVAPATAAAAGLSAVAQTAAVSVGPPPFKGCPADTKPLYPPHSMLLYFADGNILHGLINNLLLSNELPRGSQRNTLGEINYMAYVQINVYQNKYGEVYADIQVSSGASDNPSQRVPMHTLPINTPILIADAISYSLVCPSDSRPTAPLRADHVSRRGWFDLGWMPKLLFTKVNPLATRTGEVLKGIVAVYRHGDRTPKQKMKMAVTDPRLIAFFGDLLKGTRNLTLKQEYAPAEFEALGQLLNNMIAELRATTKDSAETEDQMADKMQQRQQQSIQGLLNLRDALRLSLQGTKLQVKVLRTEKVLVCRPRQTPTQLAEPPPEPSPMADSDGAATPAASAQSAPSSPAVPLPSHPADPRDASPTSGGPPRFTRSSCAVLVICKWGGVLTHAGVQQAKRMGSLFRQLIMPNKDKRVFSNNERRVQRSAAAFAEALFNVPALPENFIIRDHELLNDTPAAAQVLLQDMKRRLSNVLLQSSPSSSWNTSLRDLASSLPPGDPRAKALLPMPPANPVLTKPASQRTELEKGMKLDGEKEQERNQKKRWIFFPLPHSSPLLLSGRPLAERDMHQLMQYVAEVSPSCGQRLTKLYELTLIWIKELDSKRENQVAMCEQETLSLMRHRWAKVAADLYNPKTGQWDTSKIPDLWDGIVYDCIHHHALSPPNEIATKFAIECNIVPKGTAALGTLDTLRLLAKPFADLVGSQEFGITHEEKIKIGSLIAGPLLGSVLDDIDKAGLSPSRSLSLYFTSEAHMHSMLNVLLLSGPKAIIDRDSISEIDYMTHFIFKVFEKPQNQQPRVEAYFSTGAVYSPNMELGPNHAVPIDSTMLLYESLTLQQLHQLVDPIRSEVPTPTPPANSQK